MGYEDRDYHRQDYGGTPLQRAGRWLLDGRVHLFRAFGIDVQAHAFLIVAMALTLVLIPLTPGFAWQDAMIATVLLFAIVLLHEFGHCFGARWVGGDADQIVMHPLGGLALTQPPTNWKAYLITTLCGPAVNVVLCIACGIGLYLLVGAVPWNPTPRPGFVLFRSWTDPAWLLYWTFQANWSLLLFNLLPVYPLDGGRAVQEIAWGRVGYYRSMLVVSNVGFVACILTAMVAFLTQQFGLLVLAFLGIFSCLSMKRQLAEAGPYGFSEYDDPASASFQQALRDNRRSNAPSKAGKRQRAAAAKAADALEKERARVVAEATEIDRILAKVSASGMHSLSRGEQKTLRDATARQNREDATRPTARR